MSIHKKLSDLEEKKRLLVAEETIFMQKAFQSDNPHDLIKAMDIYNSRQGASKQQVMSVFTDATYNRSSGNYLTTPRSIPPETLRAMARQSPIIRAIIDTYIEKVSDFMEPQSDKYSTGFVIEKKNGYFNGDDTKKTTKEDKQKIELITEFLLRGCINEELDDICDDLNTWSRKFVRDSLTLDLGTSEIIWNKANTLPVGFVATDAATFYFATNTFEEDGTYNIGDQNKRIAKYVQVIDGQIRNEFFEEELMFGIRNPQTSLRSNGYGESELEILINTVTAMLNGDAYNANIFKVGSIPSGILQYKGSIDDTRLQEFKTQWMAEMSGVKNHGKLAAISAEDMNFIDMSKTNRDMEYSKYQEYLIKLACAVYKISPEEVGFTIQGSGSSSLNQDSGEARLKYSRDKGLKPLLTFLQRQINKKIVSKIDPTFRFRFVGLEADSEDKELERLIKKGSSYMSVGEMREKAGLPKEIEKDDFISSPTWIQWNLQQQQMKMQGSEESNRFMEEEDQNPFEKSWNENPMAKDFENFIKDELITN